MITRIVKMSFRADGVEPFLANFDKIKALIRNFDGCEHLELWNDVKDSNTFFTYSQWQSENHLNAYRNSELFKETWIFTKALFKEKAVAWSVNQLEKLD